MATNTAGTGNEVVGKVVILYGTVKAIAPDGTVRLLMPNSPIFANDRIVTESDGNVSIMFDGTPPSQMDLGRMSSVMIDEDVYAGVAPSVASDAAAEAEQIQQALMAGDQPIDIEATAAGGGTGAGGGHPLFVVNVTGGEVTPTSGAETTGVTFGTTGTQAGAGTNTVTLTDMVSVDEGGNITYTATLDHGAFGDIVVTLSNGSQITIPNGATSGTVTVPAPTDDVYIDAGTVTAIITGATGGSETLVVNTTPVVTAIPDTLDSTTFSLSGPPTVHEGAAATYTVTLDHATQTPMTFDVTYTYLSASTNDIVTHTTQVTIASGQSSAQFSVDAVNDQIFENTEGFQVSISNPQGGNFEQLSLGNATVETKILDANTPTISIDGGSATEGNPVTFTLHQSVVSDHDTTVTVQVVGVAADTATAGADYTPVTTLDVTILAGQQDATFNVSTLTDLLQEGSETFTAHIVSATSPNGALNIGTADAIGTILDVYTPPVISIGSGIEGGSATEGNPVTFTIHQDTISDHDTTVTVQVVGAAGDTAAAGTDYTPITTLDVTILAGQQDATFDVATLTDLLQEGSETFTAHIVSAANPNGAVIVGNADAIGTILDVYTPPVISIGSGIDGGSATEGNPVTFTIHQDAISDHDTTVTVQVIGVPADTAVAGVDYMPVTTLDVTILAGQHDATFNVDTLTDLLQEGSETFTAHIVSAANPNGAVIVGTADAIGTILDAYIPPVINIAAIEGGSATEGNPVTFTLHQDTISDHDTTVTVQVVGASGDTAIAGADYTPIATLDVTILAGQHDATFNVATLTDQLQEGNETFTAHIVSAANPNGAVLVGTADAVGTILDTYIPPMISIAAIQGGSATEGNPVTFSLHQNTVSDHDTTVTVQVVGAPGDTATAGADYTPIATLDVIILAGQQDATFNVNSLTDQFQEVTESFTAHILNATNPNGAVIVGNADAVGHILDAYTPPVVNIGTDIEGGSALEGSPVTFTVSQTEISDHDTTVTVQVVGAPGDTATAGLDYTTITSYDVIIHAGDLSATFEVATLPDQLQEVVPETFTAHIVSASNPNGAVIVGTADAIGHILDANVAPLDTTASVNESAMDTVMSGSDLAAGFDTGTNPASPNETATGNLHLQTGWTAVASSGITSYGTYEIHTDGSFAYTLLNAPDVSGASTSDVITYSITNGSVIQTNNTLTVSIVDDAPVLAVTNGIFQNSADTVLEGTLATIGADTNLSPDHLIGSYITLTGTPPAGLTSLGHAVTYTYDDGGSVIHAMAGGNEVFTLSGNPDGTYSFEQHQLLDLSVLTSNLQSSVGAGGPQPAYYMYTDGTFGSDAAAKAWSVAISSDSGHTINPSTQGMGVDNNLFQSGEKMHFEFDDEGASGTSNLAYQVDIAFNGLGSGESVNWNATFTDGAGHTQTLSGAATSSNTVNGHLVITAPSDNLYLDYVDMTAGADTSVRATSVTAYTLDTSITKTLGFGFTATDADGDSVSGTFSLLAQNSTILTGGAGNDALGGGDSINTLSGGVGNDILTGGEDADIFKASAGHDHITDYSKVVDGDVVDISNLVASATRANLSA